jgi:hypothetical protein
VTVQRCELSELPVEQCACRKHKPGQAADQHPGADIVRDGGPGPVITAQYPGQCVTCGDRFQVGDLIRPVTTMGGTRWGHAECFDY